ncbi:cyclic nucleotide-binding domain containing protein [Stylonychia lemnae]|uniref:Cyclic nucleotide-binding domain containing protein n=1 Tax=Stylonychia lemnae TaxID=5949 RepID=A0A078AHL4_STYLE|nr:cyclic nucleotide-binding domain containing protein [Stylonychia lemnae]|eukprot:CDW81356.1 cyclic nucleotide-binding domain containing protein [Stylonychia lemnae]
MKESDFIFLCERAKYEFFHSNKNVFQHGDYGDKFYIILDGQVQVLVPKRREKNLDEIKEDDDFINPDYETLSLLSRQALQRKNKMRNSVRAIARILSGISQHRKYTQPEFSRIKSSKQNDSEDLSLQIQDSNKKSQNGGQVQTVLLEVAQLKQGQSFGELALISNKPRAATIKCITDTHFLVLFKKDYEQILGRHEEANMNKIVLFLKSLPQFNSWMKNALSKLTYYLVKQKFK